MTTKFTTTEQELRKAIDNILDMVMMDGFEMAWDQSKITLEMRKDEFNKHTDELLQLIHSEKKALLARIDKEVIGKDEEFNGIADVRLDIREAQNWLKDQQRQKLAALEREEKE